MRSPCCDAGRISFQLHAEADAALVLRICSSEKWSPHNDEQISLLPDNGWVLPSEGDAASSVPFSNNAAALLPRLLLPKILDTYHSFHASHSDVCNASGRYKRAVLVGGPLGVVQTSNQCTWRACVGNRLTCTQQRQVQLLPSPRQFRRGGSANCLLARTEFATVWLLPFCGLLSV